MIKKTWKFFCSVKLAVILFILILIPSVVGTIIQQNAPDPTRYIEVYGPTLDGLFQFLGFYDVYHDSRFIILLVLLGLNTFACTLNRFKARWNIAGMLMIHLGLLLILVGALVGAALGLKGFMVIHEDETTDHIRIDRANETTYILPFKVRLVDFILDLHDEPEHKLLVLDEKTGAQHAYNIENEKPLYLSKPQWAGMKALLGIKQEGQETITVERFFSHAAMTTSLTEGPEKTDIAAVEFRVISNTNEKHGYALSHPEHPYIIENADMGIGYSEISGRDLIENEIEKLLPLFRASSRLEVTVPESARRMSFPAEVGSQFTIDGTGYSVKILRYVPDFVMDVTTREIISKSESPKNPALHVEITGPTASTKQWVFSKFPSMHEAAELPFEMRFEMEEGLSGISHYVLISNVAERETKSGLLVAAHVSNGELLSKTDIEIGQPTEIVGTNSKIIVDRILKNANMLNELVERPDISDQRAIEVTLNIGDSAEKHFLGDNTPIELPGLKVVYLAEDRIRDFYSILQVVDGDTVVAEKKIEVNDPLRYKGYALYQSSWDDEHLSWSGLQVKKDPGVPIVYAGFVIQIIGMVVVFYVNPLVRIIRKSHAARGK